MRIGQRVMVMGESMMGVDCTGQMGKIIAIETDDGLWEIQVSLDSGDDRWFPSVAVISSDMEAFTP